MNRSSDVRRDGAFTMVEMLIVITIVVLIAGLVIPMTMNAVAQAQLVKCKSQMGEIYKALNLYANDYMGLMPPALQPLSQGEEEGDEEPATATATNLLWDPLLQRVGLGVLYADKEFFPNDYNYIGNPKVFFCPTSDTRTHNGDDGLDNWGSENDPVICSYLYRGNTAGASMNIEQNNVNDRALLIDYNTYVDGTEDFNHGGRVVNILYGNGNVTDYKNEDNDFTCLGEKPSEYDKVFINADSLKALDEEAPLETPVDEGSGGGP